MRKIVPDKGYILVRYSATPKAKVHVVKKDGTHLCSTLKGLHPFHSTIIAMWNWDRMDSAEESEMCGHCLKLDVVHPEKPKLEATGETTQRAAQRRQFQRILRNILEPEGVAPMGSVHPSPSIDDVEKASQRVRSHMAEAVKASKCEMGERYKEMEGRLNEVEKDLERKEEELQTQSVAGAQARISLRETQVRLFDLAASVAPSIKFELAEQAAILAEEKVNAARSSLDRQAAEDCI